MAKRNLSLNEVLKAIKKMDYENLLRLRQALNELIADRSSEITEREAAFHRKLVEMDLMDLTPQSISISSDLDRTPVICQGQPVSETIIRDRR